jgi:hypothetical protein
VRRAAANRSALNRRCGDVVHQLNARPVGAILNDVYASVVLTDAMQIPDRNSKNRAQDQAVDACMSNQQNISLRAGNNLGQCAGDSRATIGKALAARRPPVLNIASAGGVFFRESLPDLIETEALPIAEVDLAQRRHRLDGIGTLAENNFRGSPVARQVARNYAVERYWFEPLAQRPCLLHAFFAQGLPQSGR